MLTLLQIHLNNSQYADFTANTPKRQSIYADFPFLWKCFFCHIFFVLMVPSPDFFQKNS